MTLKGMLPALERPWVHRADLARWTGHLIVSFMPAIQASYPLLLLQANKMDA